MRASGRIVAWVGALLSACATGGSTLSDLDHQLLGMLPDAYGCTPALLAEADVALELYADARERAEPASAQRYRARAEARLVELKTQAMACRPKDTDGDGVADRLDDCVLTPGTAGGCPDGDKDGIADLNDHCPSQSEDFDGVEDHDGCLDDQDTDGDGLLDGRDACPEQVGPMDRDGCPTPSP